MDLSAELIEWYSRVKRDLPWRNTSDPYKIWISEVILQQTRVAQGLDYYLHFLHQFPDVQTLADTDLNEVLKVWQGLGYYSRARYLHEASRYIVQHYDGKLPSSYSELLRIKGIGEYSAAAIASFAFNVPVPLIDGNVFRVLSRLFLITHPKNTGRAKKQAREIAEKIMDQKRPGLHNQAIMEFGAMQCIPRNPDCHSCFLKTVCKAYKTQSVERFPVSPKKIKPINRYMTYLVILSSGTLLIKKRSGNDIWKGLYDFPVIETTQDEPAENIYRSEEWRSFFPDKKPAIKKVTKVYRHLLSHQKIHARFLVIDIKGITCQLSNGYEPVPLTGIGKYPVPRLIERFLKAEGMLR